VQDVLRMSEQQTFLIRLGIVMGIVNIGLDLWLIPTHGAIGAAWANGIAQAMAALGLTVFASWKLGLSVPLGDMGRILLACLPMVVVVRLLADWLHHWPAVLIALPLGAALYALSLRFLGVLGRADQTRLASLERMVPSILRPAYIRALAWLVAGV
jgi:Na+-driven multidrug efflux pump